MLVTTGPTSLQALVSLEEEGQPPDHRAAGLSEAVEWLLQDVQRRVHGYLTVEERV